MRSPKPHEIVITFKADQTLLDAIKAVPNRSQFIRNAILAALKSSCPLCGGTGVLTPNQRNHWEAIAACHPLHECDDCHEVHIVCGHGEGHDHRPLHKRR